MKQSVCVSIASIHPIDYNISSSRTKDFDYCGCCLVKLLSFAIIPDKLLFAILRHKGIAFKHKSIRISI